MLAKIFSGTLGAIGSCVDLTSEWSTDMASAGILSGMSSTLDVTTDNDVELDVPITRAAAGEAGGFPMILGRGFRVSLGC